MKKSRLRDLYETKQVDFVELLQMIGANIIQPAEAREAMGLDD